MENNKTPSIRFKGFTDPWEQRKFSDIVARESSISTSTTDIPSVEYEDVVAEEGRLNKDVHLKETVKSGITFDGSQVLYGKLRPYLHNWLNPDFKGIAVGDWWVLKPINIDKKFLYRLIQTQQFDNIANQSSGSKMPRADWNLISNSEFTVPFSKEEQSKIGRYFDSLDNLITLHQRKYNKLLNVKKSMLEKMFPKNGSNIPEIRFKGFTDPWEQRKLEDIVGIYDGVHQTPNYQNSGVMFLSVENIATLKSSKFISEEDFKRDYKVFPQENDILMTRIGDVGTTNVVTDNGLKAYYVSLALLKYKSTDPYFLSNAIQSDYVQKELANRTLKTAIPMKINKDEIGKVSVMLPLSATEQQQIGTYFRNLDDLITLHQRELEKLQNIKKSMLEKMFV